MKNNNGNALCLRQISVSVQKTISLLLTSGSSLKKNNSCKIFSGLLFLLFLSCCKHDSPSPENNTPVASIDYKGYPKDIASIMITKCATPGCHTDSSRIACAGLSLTSWDKMFEGANSGSTIVPYRPNQSPLLAFVNSKNTPEFGTFMPPQMPYNTTALSKDEIKLLYNWVVNGAPNDKGQVKFADNPDRPKFYVVNQGCDLVTVFDRQTGLAMRYVDVGISPAIEAPHVIKKSPDGQYWYVVFYTIGLLQQFSTTTDAMTGQVKIPYSGSWSTFDISPDGKMAAVVDWEGDGKIALIDLVQMKILPQLIQGSGLLSYPHGIAFNKDGKTLYVTGQTGNFYYKIDISNPNFPNVSNQISLEANKQINTNHSLDPHFIAFTPDKSEFYVTCQHSNEVRCYSAANDSLLAVIPVGSYPQELEFSTTTPFLFVTCTEDTTSGVPMYSRGSVAVINYKAHTLQKKICDRNLFQPHGIGVSDKGQKVYVASRNVNPNGPAPHHSTLCGGRNGYIQAIDLNTLTIIPGYKPEVTVDPYSIIVKD